jgi:hypothetical protein
MIHEPISDLKRILGEPVEEVTAEHRAILDATDKIAQDTRKETAGRVPTLRPRLTVRLVALEQSQPEAVPVVFSGPYTPAPGPNDPTPAPEGYDYDEDDEDWGDPSIYLDTPPYLDTPFPQTGASSNPYTPIPNNDIWLSQYRIELPAKRVRHSDPALPILLPTLPEIVDADVVPAKPIQRGVRRYFDPTLAVLTFLLLLGILGGIGFGYLLTLINQG